MLPSLPRRPDRELEEVVYDRAEGTSVPGECRRPLRQRLQGPAKLPPPGSGIKRRPRDHISRNAGLWLAAPSRWLSTWVAFAGQ